MNTNRIFDSSGKSPEDVPGTQTSSRKPDQDSGEEGSQPPVSRADFVTTIIETPTGIQVKATVAARPVISISEGFQQQSPAEILSALTDAISHTSADAWKGIGEVILEQRFEVVSQGYACRILPRTEE